VSAALSLRNALPDPAEVWHTLKTADDSWLALAAVAQVGSMLMFALQQRRLLRVFGVSMPINRAIALTYARTAISIAMPAGAAISSGFALRQFRSRGADIGAATAVIIAAGVQSIAALVLVYLAWFASVGVAGHQESFGLLIGVSAVAVTVIALCFLPRRRHRRAAGGPRPVSHGVATPSIQRRPRWLYDIVEAAANSLRSASSLTARDWAAGGGYAMANVAADVACLLAVAHALGLGLPVIAIVGAYLAVQIVRQLPITPGGIGLVEAGLLVALVTAGGRNTTAAAVVLIYRLLSCWLVAPVGLVAWIGLRAVPAARPVDDVRSLPSLSATARRR